MTLVRLLPPQLQQMTRVQMQSGTPVREQASTPHRPPELGDAAQTVTVGLVSVERLATGEISIRRLHSRRDGAEHVILERGEIECLMVALDGVLGNIPPHRPKQRPKPR